MVQRPRPDLRGGCAAMRIPTVTGVKRRDRPSSERRIGRSRSTFGRSTVGVGYFDPTNFGASHLVSLARIQGPAGRAAPPAVVVAPPGPSICHNEVTITGDPTVPRGRPYSRHDDLAIIEACMPKAQRVENVARDLGRTPGAVTRRYYRLLAEHASRDSNVTQRTPR